MEAAQSAVNKAHAPYSGFKVGAAVLLEDGTIVTGNNQENAVYPTGLCAERVALFYASSQYPGLKIIAIAIIAQSSTNQVAEPVSPCGSCRQAISEYEHHLHHPIKIIMSSFSGNSYICDSVAQLLPLLFNRQHLM